MSREGKRIRTEHLELRAVASLLRHPRVGIIVGKHRHNSVERNRLKRRLREAVRRELLAELPSVDLVIRARPEAYGTSYAALARELVGGARRVHRLFGARVESGGAPRTSTPGPDSPGAPDAPGAGPAGTGADA